MGSSIRFPSLDPSAASSSSRSSASSSATTEVGHRAAGTSLGIVAGYGGIGASYGGHDLVVCGLINRRHVATNWPIGPSWWPPSGCGRGMARSRKDQCAAMCIIPAGILARI